MTVAALIDSARARGIELWAESGQLKLRAPKGALTDDLRERLLANKTAIVAHLQELAAPKVPPIAPARREAWERLPLSFAQERLWFITQLDPESAAYNIPAAVTIRGELDIDLLERAYQTVIDRHETLRTIFPVRDGVPEQRILERLPFRLQRIDLRAEESRRVRREKARLLMEAELRRPFDLAAGPLVRGAIAILSAEEHVLLLSMHHIVSDAWSMGLLIREIGTAMEALARGERPALPPLPIQYADYSIWQRAQLESSELLARQLAYWQQKLAGAPESLDLVTDRPRSAEQNLTGASHPFGIDAALTAQLNDLARRHDCSLFMVLLAAFKVLLYRHSGQDDLCVGSPIANRHYRETENLIGMFTNTQVLRTRMDGEESFSRLLARVRATCLEAYEHQDAPFEKVVDRVQPARNVAVNPLFQVMLILHNTPLSLDDHIRPYPLESGVSRFELTLALNESAEGLAGMIEYRTPLFEETTIARLAAHYTALCRAIVAAPETPVGRLGLASDAELRRLIVDFNDTAAPYDREACIHDWFVAQAEAGPERRAVVCGGDVLTYGGLYAGSEALAYHLQSAGVGPDTLVALCAARSLDLIVGVFGILRAGGAYVPLDIRSPDERLADILADARPAVILTQAALVPRLAALAPEGTPIVSLDREGPEIDARAAAWKRNGGALRRETRADHLAYVIYTSGSTGKPKGVLLPHRTLTNLIAWQEREIPLGTGHNVLNFNEPIFDVFMQELGSCFASGATLVIPDAATKGDSAALARFIVESGVHSIFLAFAALPGLLDELAAHGDAMPLRNVITGGEQLVINESLSAFFRRYPRTRLHDHYGPSEAHVVTAHALGEDVTQWSRFPSIGKPIANTRIYILDRHDRPQPLGVAGELHIGGDGLARGYLNRPELDREKFVADPFHPGERMYRTGDLARWRSDGMLEFLGRMDTQVKIRGFRVETGEIEARLLQHPGIAESVVVPQGEGADKRLVAFYRPMSDGGPDGVPAEELRTHLRRALPEHMIPAAFVRLESIPHTATGKVDRRALQRLDIRLESSRPYVEPRTETERRLARIWGEVLRRPPDGVGIDDNFFELGGHSLLATQVMFRVRAQLGVDVPLKALFEHGTIAGLAGAVDGSTAQRPEAIVWNRPFRLLKVQRDSIVGGEYRPIVIPVTYLVTEPVALDALKRSLEALLEHPALRLRLRRDGEEWAQYYDAGAPRAAVEIVDLGEERPPAAALMSLYDAHAPALHPASELVRCFIATAGTQTYILLLVEHFVCDPLTVILLLDLLGLCCKGEEEIVRAYVSRPALSLQQWVSALERRARDEDVLQWRDWWRATLDSAQSAERRFLLQSASGPLSREQTLRVPGDLVKAADALVREAGLGSLENVILALFARSCGGALGEEALHLTQAFNTRHDPLVPLDSSQTFGWFAENYPLPLRLPRTDDVVEMIRDLTRQKQEIEARRLGYALLAHYNDGTREEFAGRPLPGLYFNYQGRGDAPQEAQARRRAFFEVFNASSTAERIVDVERFPYWLACMTRIEDSDDLHVYFIYRADRLPDERMREIARLFQESWSALGEAMPAGVAEGGRG